MPRQTGSETCLHQHSSSVIWSKRKVSPLAQKPQHWARIMLHLVLVGDTETPAVRDSRETSCPKLAYKGRKESCSHIYTGSVSQTTSESQGLCKTHIPRGIKKGWLRVTPQMLLNWSSLLGFYFFAMCLSSFHSSWPSLPQPVLVVVPNSSFFIPHPSFP